MVGCEFEGEVGILVNMMFVIVELPEHFVDVSVEEEACEGEWRFHSILDVPGGGRRSLSPFAEEEVCGFCFVLASEVEAEAFRWRYRGESVPFMRRLRRLACPCSF